jgi:hypothetical protein
VRVRTQIHAPPWSQAKVFDRNAPLGPALVLLTPHESPAGLVETQLGRTEQAVLVAGEVFAPAEQREDFFQRLRQPHDEPLLGGDHFVPVAAVIVGDGGRPCDCEGAKETPRLCAVAAGGRHLAGEAESV